MSKQLTPDEFAETLGTYDTLWSEDGIHEWTVIHTGRGQMRVTLYDGDDEIDARTLQLVEVTFP